MQLGAQSLGLGLDRQWSRTGGLPFAGGPWNNYVMHAIASVVDDLREQPGEHGLVWANGGYATKHAFGVYSTEPPADGFRHADPQDEIDRAPAPRAGRVRPTPPGPRRSRPTPSCSPATASRSSRSRRVCSPTAGGRGASSTDAATAAAMCDGEWVGTAVTLTADGTLHLD